MPSTNVFDAMPERLTAEVSVEAVNTSVSPLKEGRKVWPLAPFLP